MKVAKQLLDRNEGPVELKINQAASMKINSENDLIEVFPNIQQAMQEHNFDSKIRFTFEFWDIQIQFILLRDIELQEQILKEAMSSDRAPARTHKAILFINDENYEHFLNWSEGDSLNSG